MPDQRYNSGVPLVDLDEVVYLFHFGQTLNRYNCDFSYLMQMELRWKSRVPRSQVSESWEPNLIYWYINYTNHPRY